LSPSKVASCAGGAERRAVERAGETEGSKDEANAS
jgi:hypothetical protein